MPPMNAPLASMLANAAASSQCASRSLTPNRGSRTACSRAVVSCALTRVLRPCAAGCRAMASASVGQVATAWRACVRSLPLDRLGVDDRVAPLVERDPLGQELRAEAVAVARDRVEQQVRLHRHGSSFRTPDGPGSIGVRCIPAHAPWRSCQSTCSENVSSALRTSLDGAVRVPAGARPSTSRIRRAARSRAAGSLPWQSSARSRAIAGSPCWQGPHWRALCAARYRAMRVVSQRPHDSGAGRRGCPPRWRRR